MKKAVADVAAWVNGIDKAGRAERDPHRRAILENYLQHVALEFNGRWEEFLGPEMTVAEPVYHTRLGTPGVYTADGYSSVLGFYRALNEDTVLTNHDERLAVADWGFASYNTFNMFTRGRHLASLGIKIADCEPEAHYRVSRPIAMFWNYTADAKLIGEDVYEVTPATVERIDASEAPTWEEVRETVKAFLPQAPLMAKKLAA